MVPLLPAECGHCGTALPDAPPNPRAIPAVFQHIELPALKLVVTEYHRDKRSCPCCGKKTRAPLPEGIGPSRLGPRLHATIAVLTQEYRLGRRLHHSRPWRRRHARRAVGVVHGHRGVRSLTALRDSLRRTPCVSPVVGYL